MKTQVKFLILLYFFFFIQELTAQVDTIYNIGLDRNRFTLEELNQHLEERRAKIKEDDGLVLRFEVKNEVVLNDTLVKYVVMHYIALSILDDEDKTNIRLNNKLPSFEFVDLEGKTLNSDELIGKVVLINFWFTRCAPCIEEMPYLDQIKEAYEKEGVVFISMAPEELPRIEYFLEKHDFSFRHIPDADAFLKKFGVGFPKNILIDKEGVIRYIDSGIMGVVATVDDRGNIKENYELEWDALRAKIEKLIAN